MQPQPTVVQMQPVIVAKPPDNLILSIFACCCCNGFCLGLVALICAIQSQSDYGEGNIDGARSKGETAKKLSIAAIILTILVTIIVVILFFVAPALFAGTVLSSAQSNQNQLNDLFNDMSNNQG